MILYKKKYKAYLLIILSFLVLSILSNIILMHSHMLFDAWDMQFHFKRIEELISSFHHLIIPSFSFNQFNGSAVMMCYPYLNLLPIIIISYFVKSKIIIIYIFFILNTFISLLISFFSSLNINCNYLTSYLFSIIYSLSTVLIGYDYVFMDIGMASASVFLPLVIFGFFNLLNNNHYIELTIGIILIFYCHILSIIIILFLLFILLLLNYKKWTSYLFISLFKSAILSILTSSLVWVPIIYLFLTNKIHTPALIPLQGLPNDAVIKSLFGGTSPMGLGTFVFISIIVSILFWKKLNDQAKKYYLFSVIIIFICSKLFPWAYLPMNITRILSHFQFSYRFLPIPILLLVYIYSYIITKLIVNKKLEYFMIFLSLLCAIGMRVAIQQHFVNSHLYYPNFSLYNSNEISSIKYKMIDNNQVNKLINFRPNGLDKNGYGADYYPEDAVHKIKYINRNECIYNKNNIINLRPVGYNKFLLNNSKNKRINELILPLLHYNSEHLYVYDNHHLVNYHSKNNLIMLNNIKKGRNIIEIKYIPSIKLTLIKDIMTLSGALIIISYSFKWLRKERN